MNKPKSKRSLPIILAVIGLCLACICISLVVAYFLGDTIMSWFSPAPQNNTPPTPLSNVVPPSNQAEWTVIVYSDADDEVLEGSMWFDVNEMELVGSTDQVNIVVQMDRYVGAWSRDGDWTGTRRLYITQDSDMSAIHSPVVQDLGEADMGDPQTLADFVTWAIQNYPANKYALVMSDHGGGWTGGFSDGSSNSKLSIPEISAALDQARANTGLDKFELFGFDACLMGQIEIYGTFYPISNYMVASEEVIPAFGWAYAGWLDQLVQNPYMDGGSLGQAIVSTYVVTDAIMTESRATDEEIAQQEAATTLSAVDSSRLPEVIFAMNQFTNVVAGLDQRLVAEARTYARNFYPLFGENTVPPYIDLYNFSEVLTAATGDPDVEQASYDLQVAIYNAVIAEKHGSSMSGSYGVSFYFPDSDIYAFTELNSSFQSYADSVSSFLQQSSWDEFMAYHYLGVAYIPQEGQAYVPSRTSEVVAPGASELTIGPLQISDTEITGDEVVTVSTTVTGNVAYVYSVLYFYNPDTDSFWVGDISYYIADNTVEIGGVNFPDYGTSPIQVQYDWSPTLFILTDGSHEAYALFEPAEYLSSDGRTIYAVYGQYTAVGETAPVDAVIYFDSDGSYLYAYAFPDDDGDGASTPVALQPQPGDQFTDYVQSILFDESDNPYYDYSPSEDVWTWGDTPFSFYAAYPVDGDYAVGILAYDFDNNFVESYEYITYTYEP
jgi:Clostripain family